MRHTSSMVCTPSPEADELYLYSVNTSDLYFRMILPVLRNLSRYARKGAYDHEKAVDAFYPVATEGARMYAREFASEGYSFTVTERYTAACLMVERWEDDILGGEDF